MLVTTTSAAQDPVAPNRASAQEVAEQAGGAGEIREQAGMRQRHVELGNRGQRVAGALEQNERGMAAMHR